MSVLICVVLKCFYPKRVLLSFTWTLLLTLYKSCSTIKNNSWLKQVVWNLSHFKNHISAILAKRSGLRSIVTRPVINLWDIDHHLHCCMQLAGIHCAGLSRVSVWYDSDCWHHLRIVGLKCHFENGINFVHQCLIIVV